MHFTEVEIEDKNQLDLYWVVINGRPGFEYIQINKDFAKGHFMAIEAHRSMKDRGVHIYKTTINVGVPDFSKLEPVELEFDEHEANIIDACIFEKNLADQRDSITDEVGSPS